MSQNTVVKKQGNRFRVRNRALFLHVNVVSPPCFSRKTIVIRDITDSEFVSLSLHTSLSRPKVYANSEAQERETKEQQEISASLEWRED